MPMRRLCLILLCGLVAVPAALAAASTPGDGVLELKNADANIIVAGSRGTLWGQMDKGRLIVTDPIAGDGTIYVSGAEKTHSVSDAVTIYSGIDIHFRVTAGKYRLNLKGVGIDFTAVGLGTAQLSGDVLAFDPGNYSLDSGKWIPVPFFPATRIVQFGVPPTTAPPTP